MPALAKRPLAVEPDLEDDAPDLASARSSSAREDSRQASGEIEGVDKVRRQVRRAHRVFRLSLTTIVVVLLLGGQLFAAVWLRGLSVSEAHRANKLGDATSGEIGRVNEAIASNQKQLAAMTSPAQLQKWADERGWKMAQPESFDDVSKMPAPVQDKSSPEPAQRND